VAEWVGGKAQVLVLNRVDMILPAQQLWVKWFKAQREEPFFTNAQDGKGVAAVAQALRAGVELNQRRRDRGMLPRAVRL